MERDLPKMHEATERNLTTPSAGSAVRRGYARLHPVDAREISSRQDQ